MSSLSPADWWSHYSNPLPETNKQCTLNLNKTFIYMLGQIQSAWPLKIYICSVYNLYCHLLHRCVTRQIPVQAYM